MFSPSKMNAIHGIIRTNFISEISVSLSAVNVCFLLGKLTSTLVGKVYLPSYSVAPIHTVWFGRN